MVAVGPRASAVYDSVLKQSGPEGLQTRNGGFLPSGDFQSGHFGRGLFGAVVVSFRKIWQSLWSWSFGGGRILIFQADGHPLRGNGLVELTMCIRRFVVAAPEMKTPNLSAERVARPVRSWRFGSRDRASHRSPPR